jgi:putative oxidoreductase
MTSLTLDRTAASTDSFLSRLVAATVTTDRSAVPTLLRLVLGLVILPHGLQKTAGWFGGYGFDATMGYFGSIGIPALFGFLAIAAESAGAIALIAGIGTRIAAFGVLSVMSVAALLQHRAYFFMNWSGQQAGEGFEYHLLAGVIALAVMIAGAGRWSVDRAIAARVR